MAGYAIGLVTGAPAAGAAYLVMRPTALRPRLRRVEIINTTTTPSSVGLIRMAGYGTPATSAIAPPVVATDPASATNIDTAWSVAPTIPGTPYYRRGLVAGVVGNGVIWTPTDWPTEIATGWALWNWGASAGGALVVNLEYDE